MKSKLQILIFLNIVVLAGCVSSSEASLIWENPPCHEGWSTDKSGESKVWVPSSEELTILIPMLPKNRTLYCWHEMPSGEVFVVNSDENGEHYTNDFFRKGSTFIKGEEGNVITFSH